MSTTTTNYGLIKPDTTDPILIGQLNDNADAIDAALKENANAIENKPDAADIPTPSTAAPAMDGTAAAGTSTDYARADHIHPSDTSKQDALTAAQLAAANSGIDSAKVAQIETNKNNISFVQSQANWNTNNGVKNICPYNSGSTPSGEGTMWNNLPIDMAAGTYSLSFSTDSTNSTLVLLAADGATEILQKTYSTTTVNDTFTISTAAKYIRLYIGALKTVSNFMIHSFGDDTFVPYALSNAVITPALKECVDNGAKNLLKLGFSKKIVINQTAEMTADGNGVVINGSRNSVTDTILVYDIVTNLNDGLATRYTLPAGKYIMTKIGDANVRLQVYAHDGTNSIALGYTQVSDLHFEYTNEMKLQYPYLTFRIWVSRVSNFDNFTFYPMICTEAAWKISQSFQPYRPSYQELYEMVKALQPAT